MTTNLEKGIYYISISSLCSALFGLFVKLSSLHLPITFLMVMRFFVPLLICIPLFWVSGTFKKIKTSAQWKPAFIRSFFMVLSQYCYFYYISKSSLLNATLLFNTAPVFIPLITKFIFKHGEVKAFSKSIVISLIGVAFVIQPDQKLLMIESVVGLLSGVFLAFSQAIYAENVRENEVPENLFFVFLYSTLMSLLVLIVFFFQHFKAGLASLVAQTTAEWMFVLLIGLFTSLNQYFRGQAYLKVKPYLLAPLMNLAILFAFFLDLFIFKKTPDYLSIMGSLLIVLGSLTKWYTLRKR